MGKGSGKGSGLAFHAASRKRSAETAKTSPAKVQKVADNDKTGLNTDKATEEFRDYSKNKLVEQHYRWMREKQTLQFYKDMEKKYSYEKGGRRLMTIRECFTELESYVDASDPDLSLPNLVHMLQTAEGIRKAGKPDWFQLVGLLHDMGKAMFLFGDDSVGQGLKEQWSLGGDTFAVGCRIPDCMVFPEFNKSNPDMAEGKETSTELGIYEEKCGLDGLKFSWGHDEYMYRMLVANKAKIPKEGLAMIRYHSAYCWHTGGAYGPLLKPEDEETKKWVLEFNQFDLYTKDEHNELNVEELWPYYQGLVDKYLGTEKLMW